MPPGRVGRRHGAASKEACKIRTSTGYLRSSLQLRIIHVLAAKSLDVLDISRAQHHTLNPCRPVLTSNWRRIDSLLLEFCLLGHGEGFRLRKSPHPRASTMISDLLVRYGSSGVS